MPPKVIIHTAVSLDGRITNFPADLDLYYTLAAKYNPDAVLFGSSTILAAPTLEVPDEHRGMFTPPPGTPDPRPLMVVADSPGQDTVLGICSGNGRNVRDFVALCSSSTPHEYGELSCIVRDTSGHCPVAGRWICVSLLKRSANNSVSAPYGQTVAERSTAYFWQQALWIP